MKLTTTTDYVLEEIPRKCRIKKGLHYFEIVSFIKNYAKLMKKPLEMWYFIPCDKDGKPLDKPINYDIWKELHNSKGSTLGYKKHEEYQEADERVLFEDSYCIEDIEYFINSSKTVEGLSIHLVDFEFTQNAINTYKI